MKSYVFSLVSREASLGGVCVKRNQGRQKERGEPPDSDRKHNVRPDRGRHGEGDSVRPFIYL